jgi:hypothetical protein
VTSAISNSALRWPGGQRLTINLAPADLRKEGPSFDLPIALGMLKLIEKNRLPELHRFCVVIGRFWFRVFFLRIIFETHDRQHTEYRPYTARR